MQAMQAEGPGSTAAAGGHTCTYTRSRLLRLEFAARGDVMEARVVRAKFCACGSYTVAKGAPDEGLIRVPAKSLAPQEIRRVYDAMDDRERALAAWFLRYAHPMSETREFGLDDRYPDSLMESSARRLIRSSKRGALEVEEWADSYCRHGLFALIYRRRRIGLPPVLQSLALPPDLARALGRAMGLSLPGDREGEFRQEAIRAVGQAFDALQALDTAACSPELRGQVRLWTEQARDHLETWSSGETPALRAYRTEGDGQEERASIHGLTRRYTLAWKTILEVVRGYAAGGQMPFRELSVHVTGDSKALAGYRELLASLGLDLASWGVLEHQPIALVAGAIRCRMPSCGENLRLDCYPDYACLTLGSVLSMEITSADIEEIWVIENLTPFEAVIADGSWRTARAAVVYSGGFPGRGETTLLRKILAAAPVPGYCWTDLDLGGYRIFAAVKEVFAAAGQPLRRMGAEVRFVDGASSRLPLDHGEWETLSTIMARTGDGSAGTEISWLRVLLARNVKVEQEAQLPLLEDILATRGESA